MSKTDLTRNKNGDVDFTLNPSITLEMLQCGTSLSWASYLVSSLLSWTVSRCPHSNQHHLVKTKVRSCQWPVVSSRGAFSSNLLTIASRVFRVLAACLPLWLHLLTFPHCKRFELFVPWTCQVCPHLWAFALSQHRSPSSSCVTPSDLRS